MRQMIQEDDRVKALQLKPKGYGEKVEGARAKSRILKTSLLNFW